MYVYFNTQSVVFGFFQTQRCYTISHCYNDESTNSHWGELPHPGQMVWFADKHCKGDSIARNEKQGTISFIGTKLYKKVSSFMVRQYGLYPTNGIVDYCHENATLASTNSSSILYINLDGENVGTQAGAVP